MKPKALLVDDLATHGRLAYCELVRWFDVTVTGNAMEALILLEEHRFDVVIAELNLGAGPNGIDVMRAVAETDPGARRVLMSKWLRAGRLTRDAAHRFVLRPWPVGDLLAAAVGVQAEPHPQALKHPSLVEWDPSPSQHTN